MQRASVDWVHVLAVNPASLVVQSIVTEVKEHVGVVLFVTAEQMEEQSPVPRRLLDKCTLTGWPDRRHAMPPGYPGLESYRRRLC